MTAGSGLPRFPERASAGSFIDPRRKSLRALMRLRHRREQRGDPEAPRADGNHGCSRERHVDAQPAAGSRREVERDQPHDQDREDYPEDVGHRVEGEVGPEEPEPAAGDRRRNPADAGDHDEDIPHRDGLPPGTRDARHLAPGHEQRADQENAAARGEPPAQRRVDRAHDAPSPKARSVISSAGNSSSSASSDVVTSKGVSKPANIPKNDHSPPPGTRTRTGPRTPLASIDCAVSSPSPPG